MKRGITRQQNLRIILLFVSSVLLASNYNLTAMDRLYLIFPMSESEFAESVFNKISNREIRVDAETRARMRDMSREIQASTLELVKRVSNGEKVPREEWLAVQMERKEKMAEALETVKPWLEKELPTIIRLINQKRLLAKVPDDKSKADPSLMTQVLLQRRLRLAPAQVEKIEQLAKQAAEKVVAIEAEMVDEWTRLQQERYERAVSLLEMPANQIFSRIHGDVVDWAGAFPERLLQDPDRFTSTIVLNDYDTDSRKGKRSITPELDYHWFCLLKTEGLVGELELTDRQQKQLARFLDGRFRFLPSEPKFNTARLTALVNEAAAIPEEMESILLPHQRRRLAQIEFQFRTLNQFDTFGLSVAAVQEKLKIDEALLAKLKAESRTFKLRRQARFKAQNEKIVQALSTAYRQMLGVLEPQQRVLYGRIIGPLLPQKTYFDRQQEPTRFRWNRIFVERLARADEKPEKK